MPRAAGRDHGRPVIRWQAALAWGGIFIGLPALTVSMSNHGLHPLPSPTPSAQRASVTPYRQAPIVEPMQIRRLAPRDARAINGRTPFSSAPNPPALPFRFAGGADQEARAVDCLAAAALYEAGDDPTGQKAVAQVVLNRVRHPAFPKSVCGVVFQGSERLTGCQFTFTCDGALRRVPATGAWERARILAASMLAGTVDSPVGYATHYHTDWVVPYWSSSLDKITSVGTHLFFRWKGWWGTPPAFRAVPGETEPSIVQLSFLSPAHRNALMHGQDRRQPAPDFSDVGGQSVAITRDSIGDRFGAGRLAALNSAGNAFAMLLDRKAGPKEFEIMARSMCAGRSKCRVLGWTDARMMPNAFPIDPETLDAMSYAYMRASDSGLERSLFNCTEFRTIEPARCMRKRVPEAQSSKL